MKKLKQWLLPAILGATCAMLFVIPSALTFNARLKENRTVEKVETNTPSRFSTEHFKLPGLRSIYVVTDRVTGKEFVVFYGPSTLLQTRSLDQKPNEN